MRLSEVKKFCDGTLEKIQENLIDMVIKNKLGKGNKRLKGRDWTNIDVMKSNKWSRLNRHSSTESISEDLRNMLEKDPGLLIPALL
ncbi:hypothetical protein Tco_0720840 [Tanacetum coccineum]